MGELDKLLSAHRNTALNLNKDQLEEIRRSAIRHGLQGQTKYQEHLQALSVEFLERIHQERRKLLSEMEHIGPDAEVLDLFKQCQEVISEFYGSRFPNLSLYTLIVESNLSEEDMEKLFPLLPRSKQQEYKHYMSGILRCFPVMNRNTRIRLKLEDVHKVEEGYAFTCSDATGSLEYFCSTIRFLKERHKRRIELAHTWNEGDGQIDQIVTRYVIGQDNILLEAVHNPGVKLRGGVITITTEEEGRFRELAANFTQRYQQDFVDSPFSAAYVILDDMHKDLRELKTNIAYQHSLEEMMKLVGIEV